MAPPNSRVFCGVSLPRLKEKFLCQWVSGQQDFLTLAEISSEVSLSWVGQCTHVISGTTRHIQIWTFRRTCSLRCAADEKGAENNMIRNAGSLLSVPQQVRVNLSDTHCMNRFRPKQTDGNRLEQRACHLELLFSHF